MAYECDIPDDQIRWFKVVKGISVYNIQECDSGYTNCASKDLQQSVFSDGNEQAAFEINHGTGCYDQNYGTQADKAVIGTNNYHIEYLAPDSAWQDAGGAWTGNPVTPVCIAHYNADIVNNPTQTAIRMWDDRNPS